MLPAGVGQTIGLTASLAVNRILKSKLMQVSPNDPITLVVALAGLILAAVLGCLIPAHHARRTDPANAIRYE